MSEYFISFVDLLRLVEGLASYSRVVAPFLHNQRRHLFEITPENLKSLDLMGFRAVEPFKDSLFKVADKVSDYFGPDTPPAPQPLTILGARGCDLEALEVLDRVYNEGDFKDPYYAANRSEVLVIGADCTDCADTCFCALVQGRPYPTKLFDLNLSPLDGGFIVEIGTEKGRQLIETNRSLFDESTAGKLEEKALNRQRVLDLLAQKNAKYKLKLDLSETHKRNLENKAWRTLTKDCVECSACNFTCPTCTCFLLLDQAGGGRFEKHKVWDACLKAGYARVAGGANPRGKLFERLQNRYHCKFDYSFDRLNRYTCVGCGRCIDGCAGSIDMRKIFVELERQVPLTAKLE